MEEDIENKIPVNNVQYSQGSAEVRVKTIKKDDKGYTETKIERHKAQTKQTNIIQPISRSRLIENTICLSIQDLLRATAVQDCCWKVFTEIFFRRVLIYGKVVIRNLFTREGRTCYRIAIDDGSGLITGTLNVSKEAKSEGSS